MSRSDTFTTADPRIPRIERTVHRRPPPVPLRVVSQRLSPAEAARAAPVTDPTTGTAAALAEPPLPSPEIVGLPAVSERPLPVLDRRPRSAPFTRLLDLVRGRRRAERCGRHRPDTTPSRAWSMFAPQRRSRRRFGGRR